AISQYEKLQDIIGKISSYSYLIYAENLSDPKHSSFYQNISEELNRITTDLLFFELELNQIEDTALARHLRIPKLGKYEPWLRDIRIMRPHQLSSDLEKMLHEKSITSRQAWHRLFEETLADMRFPLGRKQLTCTEIMNNLSSSDEKLREKSAKSIGETLGKHIKTFAQITNVLAKDKEIDDHWRKFKTPISSRNISNLIEDEVTEALISTVSNNYENIAHRYYKLKAKWFGVEQLNYWDRNAPLPGDDPDIISWEEAKHIVLSAYGRFSPKIRDIGKRFFEEGWIDAQVRKGKDSGAFSHPTVPSAHPYILMNYQGKSRDVMTLAHELGHGIHQVLASKQGALMADTPLTLAETASVFGEQLTFRSLLERIESPEQRKILIAGKVEDMINTVVRQIAFCQFEGLIHNQRRKGELSIEQICNNWMSVQSDSLGSAIKFDDEYKYYWSYIPHFIHTPFYVYAYAFGDCLVNSLYRVYQNNPEGFENKYIEMLSAGGTKRHKELLEPFDLYAGDPNFWQGGLDMIAEFIDELEAM
ncbi:M3 family oligoendopeptidase, partial [Rickettsiales bacterium]|nr:M3 family oligoendopeptidase [Rickettsiales bacterium]